MQTSSSRSYWWSWPPFSGGAEQESDCRLLRKSSRSCYFGDRSCSPMNPRLKRILVLIVGWSFILLGIVGLFLPLLQGLLFIFVGLVLLSSQYPRARLLLRKLRARFPK